MPRKPVKDPTSRKLLAKAREAKAMFSRTRLNRTYSQEELRAKSTFLQGSLRRKINDEHRLAQAYYYVKSYLEGANAFHIEITKAIRSYERAFGTKTDPKCWII